MKQKWTIFLGALRQMHSKESVQWTACVLMGSHFHLLFSISTPTENLLLTELEKVFAECLRVELPAFEHPILCEQIYSLAHYRQTYKYIYRNPVEAKICKQVQDYPWSSLREMLCPSNKVVFNDSQNLIQNPFQTLQWLNADPELMPEKSDFFRSPMLNLQ